MAEICKHNGYVMKDGALICVSCGEPSRSPRWQANVYGAEAAPYRGTPVSVREPAPYSVRGMKPPQTRGK